MIYGGKISHNPYFNRWFSAIVRRELANVNLNMVTILILIDGFLQCRHHCIQTKSNKCHNPYFNRWFSAIKNR